MVKYGAINEVLDMLRAELKKRAKRLRIESDGTAGQTLNGTYEVHIHLENA